MLSKSTTLNAYAKVNLSLDVGPVREDGMHPVDMIMQKISLCDIVSIEIVSIEIDDVKSEGDQHNLNNGNAIHITCSDPSIPTDESNLAYRAAELALREQALQEPNKSVSVKIHIEKNIPVAAGLAGGSTDAAAVLKGLNELLGLGLNIDRLCELGSELGSDVPFCIISDAAARATGTGTELKPCSSLGDINANILVAKPPIGVSTKEVYRGIDSCVIDDRPNNDEFEMALNNSNAPIGSDINIIKNNMINVLENYTLTAYPIVRKLKDMMTHVGSEVTSGHTDMIGRASPYVTTIMSGSGPTVYSVYLDEDSAISGEALLKKNLAEFPEFDGSYIGIHKAL